jgi:hypothetical protein
MAALSVIGQSKSYPKREQIAAVLIGGAFAPAAREPKCHLVLLLVIEAPVAVVVGEKRLRNLCVRRATQ